MCVQKLFNKRIENFKKLNEISSDVELMVQMIKTAFNNKNKILLCGNGGSASDCNHIAAVSGAAWHLLSDAHQ